ncbi:MULTISPECIES: 6,7-dimethyl-8-ribityllumazine synthase [Micrococcaceae]|uniref:6,7-dimethyl-8-ribityllumazine synthase n=1 Tax=Micrococcaceae TaxID=1268 RepID=UPI000CFCE46D|nr:MULTISPECIES: 6,7-dimethyl-8-ribityllumazine synthase [unclassified Arthrobacter]MCS3492592.1 6,7-dimethyl-8-ribityllumazine synthase [Arthrobacter sp. JUb119]PQZ88328.1 6,7-dimethyl-8-ribityllumazine synthase [Arthrobacter sp. MYb222]PRB76869.1 6,7-dimethyl-8-ribityllumazine synthase [Arthrobacter sp. MYb214]TDU30251.1 6,7-dimethyl-8-ribityllumazine synthase [Arthrobacter sp. JUb115]
MSKPLNVAFIKASWHADIVDQALAGFKAEMDSSGQEYTINVVSVPGAYEMPLQAQRLAKTGKYDAVVAAALVVDGGIYRHDFVAQAVVDGLMRVQLDTDVPTFSVSLTPHHFHSNDEHQGFYFEHFLKKGAEAARAVQAVAAIEL